VDWTADVSRFGALPPGVLDFIRFRVEFDGDAGHEGSDPEAAPIVLEFLRFPLRFCARLAASFPPARVKP